MATWLKKLGGKIKDADIKGHIKGAAVEGLRNAGAQAINSLLFPRRITDKQLQQRIENLNNLNFTEAYTPIKNKITSEAIKSPNRKMELNTNINSNINNFQVGIGLSADLFDNLYMLKVPNWGIDDFINERMLYRKGISALGNDIGWFYFKIFFNFDTQQGLFGGILNNDDNGKCGVGAYGYLKQNLLYQNFHMLGQRANALKKFTSILSFITTSAPWFFSGIKGLDQAGVPYINDLTKERSIEIQCNTDAVDMRLSTMLDLYKFAAYDSINCKEIIPDNLRKFNLTVVIFGAPIEILHSSVKSRTLNKTIPFSNLSSFNNFMSYKIYNFYNCEFDINTLGGTVPSDLNNETPFNLGKNSIKINYGKVNEHTANEFNNIIFGNDGFYYDQENGVNSYDDKNDIIQNLRYIALQNALTKNKMFSSNIGMHKELITASEDLSDGIFSANRSVLQKMAGNFLLKKLHTSYEASLLGNLYPNIGIGSQFERDRLKNRHGSSSATEFYKTKDKINNFSISGMMNKFIKTKVH